MAAPGAAQTSNSNRSEDSGDLPACRHMRKTVCSPEKIIYTVTDVLQMS